MPLIPKDPFDEFGELERFFDERFLPFRWFEKLPQWELPSFEVRRPRVNIYEDNSNVVAKIELPGVEPKDIEVEIEENSLKISARKKQEKEEKGRGYYRKEIKEGYFKRVIPLPGEVEGNKAQASYADGILEIVIPKKKVKKEKRIKIKVKSVKSI